jgi:RNA polymerase sigma-70 factor (sigma-E family)
VDTVARPRSAGAGSRDAGDAFRQFVVDAAPRLLRLGHALTGDPARAQDLVQETLVRIGLAWRRVRPDADPFPYARRALVNLYLNDRRRYRREHLVAEVPEPLGSSPTDAATASESLAGAMALLDRLPPRQRAAMVMRYVLDLDDARIADALGCTESTVRSQITRALETLRRQEDGHD